MKTAEEFIEPLIFPDDLVAESVDVFQFVSAKDAIKAIEEYAESRMKELQLQINPHFLYLSPDPQGQRSFRPILAYLSTKPLLVVALAVV